MVPRDVASLLKKMNRQFPVVSITGPRQAGKTTLLRNTFPSYHYVNLEDLLTLNAFKENPKGYLEKYLTKGIIIDEAQRLPELFSYLQVVVDEYRYQNLTQNKNLKSKIFLSGSQNFLLNKHISQSLAGRVANITILPFTLHEIYQSNLLKQNLSSNKLDDDLLDLVIHGMYPARVTKNLKGKEFYSHYLTTYVERDVRQLQVVKDLVKFTRFVQLLAGRVGQILDVNKLANDTDINRKTASEWLSILETSYVIFKLPPFYKNLRKRLIKRPKIYFFDTGLVCHLLNITTSKEFLKYPNKGAIFENFIISDIYKNIKHKNQNINIYFLRTTDGLEVDLILEKGLFNLQLIETKLSSNVKPEHLTNIFKISNLLTTDLELNVGNKLIIYTGQTVKFGDIKASNWVEELTKQNFIDQG